MILLGSEGFTISREEKTAEKLAAFTKRRKMLRKLKVSRLTFERERLE